jgi:hypothetical protein
MALPFSRNTTYTAGDPILSADLNAIQDCIVAGKHGDLVLLLSAAAGMAPSAANAWDFTGAGAEPFWATPGATLQHVTFPIVLPVGKRIKSFSVYLIDTAGAHTITAALVRHDPAAGTVTPVASATSSGAGGRQTITASSLTETLIAARLYHLDVYNNDATATSHTILGAAVTFDHP